MITRKHLPRRTFLRGLGAGIALPMLDAMMPAFAASRVHGKAPCRMAFAYVPNGIIMKDWAPAGAPGIAPLPEVFARTLEPLAKFREDMLLISGLTLNGGRALGDGPGDHARAAASYLTAAHPRKTAGADIFNGVSVDQVAARKLGSATRFASIELGCEDGRMVGNCDSGYSCAYSNSISWRTPTAPMPPEVNPRLVFERLFGDTAAAESAEDRARRERHNRSILDFVMEDAAALKVKLGPTDRRKLDEYLHGIREIEKRIQTAEARRAAGETAGVDHATVEADVRELEEAGVKAGGTAVPAIEKPSGVPLDYAEHVRLMFDLMLAAFQTDTTRVATFMLGREGSNRTYREIDVPEAHHGLSHHRNNGEWIEKLARINRFHMDQFALFIEKMKATQDGDGTLLDNSMVLYGSGLSDGNRHLHHDLPVALLGRAGGTIKTGRYLVYPQETPMANLYVSLLEHMGVRSETVGDAKGPLEHLAEV